MKFHCPDNFKARTPSVYISSDRVRYGLTSPRRRVSTYTVVTVLITLVLGLYIFLELDVIVGFIVIMLATFVYYARKRLEGIR